MPPYNNQPGVAVPLLPVAEHGGAPGIPGYAFGSKSTSTPNTRMIVTRAAVASNVVTLTVQIVEGNIPAAGQTIYVYATTKNSGGLNTSTGTVTISAASFTATTGAGTITYSKTTADLAGVADSGYVYALVPEVPEALATGKSQQFAVSGYGISWAYSCPSAPAAIAIQLEGAISDVDAEYTIIGSSQTTTSGYNEFFASIPENVNFARLNVTSASGGTNPTIVGKIQLTRV